MSQPNVQFAVASHVMAALGAHKGEPVRSAELASSVNAEPSFVRRVVSKLAKAGLVTTHRGKNGACALARPAAEITLLDIYRASEAPEACCVHDYAATDCVVSQNFKGCLNKVLQEAQEGFEQALAKQSLSGLVNALVNTK
ncbi:Rrf2 family transcriptional regulator [Pigmentiphaga aceris]|uniref:Rrf2 family transcriptional regulator n=1 Tax=Pigmentiphaga aceris TaxID=1940612 RepID=A0A5C0B288_9BURK|nr:Rrf2 family transcriptional regulator [Pigmentiphaga aceris]QEI08949.1 Rrf2 family transcriptional regulator [Pigmentiphaga aceris]